MKKTLMAIALVGASSFAQAQLSLTGSSASTWTGYDGEPVAQTGVLSSGYKGTLVAPGPGTVTFTYLGQESSYVDQFTFSVGSQSLHESDAVGTSIAGYVGSGALSFTFLDTNYSFAANNGSYALRYVPNITTTSYGKFDYIIGFNDSYVADGDYDDFVVGAKFTPAIPEPETYAMLLAGVGLMALVARRRTNKMAI